MRPAQVWVGDAGFDPATFTMSWCCAAICANRRSPVRAAPRCRPARPHPVHVLRPAVRGFRYAYLHTRPQTDEQGVLARRVSEVLPVCPRQESNLSFTFGR